MSINTSKRISTYLIIVVLVVGLIAIFFLADKTLQTDPFSWLQTAKNIYRTGDTGFQHRNILYSYVLSIPLFLKMNPVLFGLFVSAISLLLSALLLYKINQKFSSDIFAAYVSFIFLFSYPFLRYGTQAFTDIIAVLFLVSTVYFSIKYIREEKVLYLFLVYFSAGFAVSFRYSSTFIVIAFVYFIWITRKKYKYHIIAALIAIIPFIPQIIFNIKYLEHFYSLSYAAAHPTLSFRYFFHDFSGHNFQIFSYVKYLFFDFRGLLFVFSPFCFYGLIKAYRLIDKKLYIYFLLFFLSFLFILSFYVYFANRYIIPALIPCFIWLNIGFYELYKFFKERSALWLNIYILALAISAYGLFDLNFQLVQSSRALHEVREQTFKKLNTFAEDDDVIITKEQDIAFRFVNKRILIITPAQLSDSIYNKYYDKNFYLVKTDKRFTSQGNANYDIISTDIFFDNFMDLYQIKTKPIIELLLYRLLKMNKFEKYIPNENWHILKLKKKLFHGL